MRHAMRRVVSGDTVYFAVNLSQQDNPEGADSSGPAIPPREHQAILQPNLKFLFGHLNFPRFKRFLYQPFRLPLRHSAFFILHSSFPPPSALRHPLFQPVKAKPWPVELELLYRLLHWAMLHPPAPLLLPNHRAPVPP